MDWIYIHRTFVYCWYQCSSIIIGDSARRIRIIILTCIDTNRFESLRHPRSPLNGEIYPRHICKEDSSGSYIIHDGRLRAGYARVVTRQGVEWRKMTKNTWQYFEDEADYRLLLVSMQVSIIILILRAESPNIPTKYFFGKRIIWAMSKRKGLLLWDSVTYGYTWEYHLWKGKYRCILELHNGVFFILDNQMGINRSKSIPQSFSKHS